MDSSKHAVLICEKGRTHATNLTRQAAMVAAQSKVHITGHVMSNHHACLCRHNSLRKAQCGEYLQLSIAQMPADNHASASTAPMHCMYRLPVTTITTTWFVNTSNSPDASAALLLLAIARCTAVTLTLLALLGDVVNSSSTWMQQQLALVLLAAHQLLLAALPLHV
eukprot:GHRR01011661.1.p1 GENE.GHRR01011661.1~~GHRR01011661.1.p1  ORF type:complete len:166 (-),score=40.40 GHRR01011661.1:1767-2264(-)